MAPTLFDELKMVTGQKKKEPDLKHIEKNIKMVTGIK